MIMDKIISMFSGKADSKGRTNLNYGRGIRAVEWATRDPANTDAEVIKGGKAVSITDQGFIELATELVGGNHIGRDGQIMIPFVPHLYGKHNHGWAPPCYVPCEYSGDETTLPAFAAVVVTGVSGEGVGTCSKFQFYGEEDFETNDEYTEYLSSNMRPMGIVTGKLENDLWLVQVSGITYGYTDEVNEDGDPKFSTASLTVYPKPGTFVLETSSVAYCAQNLGSMGVHKTSDGEPRGQLLLHLGATSVAGVPRFLSFGADMEEA